MYCTVALSFQSERKPIRTLLAYKVGEHNVRTNDVVEVLYQGELRRGVVGALFANDPFNPKELPRIEIERVLHTNTIYAAVRRRFNMFKDYDARSRQSSKRAIKAIKLVHGEDYAVKIMKYVCLGSMVVEKDGLISIWHANQQLIFMREESGKLYLIEYRRYRSFKSTWRTSLKAQSYFNKLFEEYYGNS